MISGPEEGLNDHLSETKEKAEKEEQESDIVEGYTKKRGVEGTTDSMVEGDHSQGEGKSMPTSRRVTDL